MVRIVHRWLLLARATTTTTTTASRSRWKKTLRVILFLVALQLVPLTIQREAITKQAAIQQLTKARTTTNRNSEASPNNRGADDDDDDDNHHDVVEEEDASCGLIDGVENVQWKKNLSQQEFVELRELDACLRRIEFRYARDYTPFRQRNHRQLYQLQCNPKSLLSSSLSSTLNQDDVRTILRQYDRISMIGDSTLRQQFMGLVCAIDPHTTTKKFVRQDEGRQGLYEYHYYHHPDDNRTVTRIVYSKFGHNFPHEETRYLPTADFIEALRNSTDRSAIVVNAGLHYSSESAPLMKQALETLIESATRTAASVFYVEPPAQEFPTSNGQYTKQCTADRHDREKHCRCETVDRDRWQTGRGRLSQTDRINFESDVGRITPDRRLFLEFLYSSSDTTSEAVNAMIPNNNITNPAECVPDCVPGRWRIDLARKMLLPSSQPAVLAQQQQQQQPKDNTKKHYYLLDDGETTNTTGVGGGGSDCRRQYDDNNRNNKNNHNNNDAGVVVHVVPVAWQLLSLGFPVGRNSHDCTHRSSDAVSIMNHQLVRTMTITRNNNYNNNNNQQQQARLRCAN